MIKLARPILAAVLLAGAVNAQAMLIDLKAAAEPGGMYGESAWNPYFSLADFGFDVQISGVKNGNSASAYLDSNQAGMGVCGVLNGGAPVNTATHSGANLCNPSDDDNVTGGEILRFAFNESVVINRIWFNNNHDGDLSLIGDSISVFGIIKTFAAGDVDLGRGGDVAFGSPIAFTSGSSGDISFSPRNGEQFYLSAIDISHVPEPGTLVLLGVALAGLGAARRKPH